MALDSIHNYIFKLLDFGKNVIIDGVDNSSSTHTDNNKKIFQFLMKDKHKDQMIA